MGKFKQIIKVIFITMFITFWIVFFGVGIYFDTHYTEKPDGYMRVWLHCGHNYSIECYISNKDYDRWLKGDAGTILAKPCKEWDEEQRVNIASIIKID